MKIKTIRGVFFALAYAALAVSVGADGPPAWLTGPVNSGGAEGLKAALGEITRIEVIWVETGEVKAVLKPTERARLRRIIAKSTVTADLAATPAGWPAALVFRTRSRGSYSAYLVGPSHLRLNPGNPLYAGIEKAEASEPATTELALDDAPMWLNTYFQKHLGPSRAKEHSTVEPPRGLVAPGKGR